MIQNLTIPTFRVSMLLDVSHFTNSGFYRTLSDQLISILHTPPDLSAAPDFFEVIAGRQKVFTSGLNGQSSSRDSFLGKSNHGRYTLASMFQCIGFRFSSICHYISIHCVPKRVTTRCTTAYSETVGKALVGYTRIQASLTSEDLWFRESVLDLEAKNVVIFCVCFVSVCVLVTCVCKWFCTSICKPFCKSLWQQIV